MENYNQDSIKDSITVLLIRRILGMPEEQQRSLLKQLDEMTASGAGERDDVRKRFTQTIFFSIKDREYTGTSQDISAGGMFIETRDAFSVGQNVILTIPLADKGKTVRVPARIVRVKAEGIGVEFLKKI